MRELPKRPTRIFAAGAALSVMLSIILLPAPARAQDDDVPIDTKILRGIMSGLGLQRDGDETGINYQDRAPLVIPPSRTLPPPENDSAALARNPSWPKDPDVIKRKIEAEQERRPRTTEDMEAEARPLRPDQLTPGGDPRKVKMQKRDSSSTSDSDRTRVMPSELGYKGGLFGMFSKKSDDNKAMFTGELPREALTDPPSGYQTPSPDQPYGLGKEKPKAYDYSGSHGTEDH